MHVQLQLSESPLSFSGQEFTASTYGSLYHADSGTLIVSDCHFGKSTHFRKNSIPFPADAGNSDYLRLWYVLKYYRPEHCIFLGDLFHSTINSEWKKLKLLLGDLSNIRFTLVEGNHDILPAQVYEEAGLQLKGSLDLAGITLTHEPSGNDDAANICGHIHPGFGISGRARQHTVLPCFYIKKERLYMPAFSSLSGLVRMNSEKPGKAFCYTQGAFFPMENG